MTPLADLPVWAALTTAVCVLIGAGLTFTGSLGLLRLGSFYERVHAPTLGATLGTGFVLLASIVCFSAPESRPVLHELLIPVFLPVTKPVTLMLLFQAPLFRIRLVCT